jgi:hypothetical protein
LTHADCGTVVGQLAERRAKKARIQVNKLRDEKKRQEKVKKDVSRILNNIIDAVPVVVIGNVIGKQLRDIRNGKN